MKRIVLALLLLLPVANVQADPRPAPPKSAIPDTKPDAQGRYWSHAASCGGSSHNCSAAEALAGNPPANCNGCICCSYGKAVPSPKGNSAK